MVRRPGHVLGERLSRGNARFAGQPRALLRAELVGDRAWRREPTNNELLRPLGVRDRLLGGTGPAPGVDATVGLDRVGGRPGRRGFAGHERDVVRAAVEHHGWFLRRLARALGLTGPDVGALSPREAEALRLLLTGRPERAVAGEMGVTANTLHQYVKAVYAKLGVGSRAELMARFLDGPAPLFPDPVAVNRYGGPEGLTLAFHAAARALPRALRWVDDRLRRRSGARARRSGRSVRESSIVKQRPLSRPIAAWNRPARAPVRASRIPTSCPQPCSGSVPTASTSSPATGAEPPHVQVESGESEAKFWLRPVALAAAWGYSRRELGRSTGSWRSIAPSSWERGMRSSAPSASGPANARRVLREPTPVVGVRFVDDRLYPAMEGGREVGAPLAEFPRLAGATAEQRANWRTGRGLGVHWPDVDEDVHVAHLLGMSDQAAPAARPTPSRISRGCAQPRSTGRTAGRRRGGRGVHPGRP